ncbi:MAG: hypothetical protein HY474_00750 [Candidatus Sungbacteria bacterium]|uniref:Uncharacterized protein n=1 Tax=Candidatus Sungiibacteriota bacterium TaxID=2750080 RepID=A0A932YVE3_9BACT|nr:hypothetical protein [Candidatus Sungbacteria bacterium]
MTLLLDDALRSPIVAQDEESDADEEVIEPEEEDGEEGLEAAGEDESDEM